MLLLSISYFFPNALLLFLGEGRNKLHLSTYYVTTIVISALYELSHIWSQNLGFFKHGTE